MENGRVVLTFTFLQIPEDCFLVFVIIFLQPERNELSLKAETGFMFTCHITQCGQR